MINYKKDDTFLARWLSDELSEKELQDFKNSEDFEPLSKIAKKSLDLEVPDFDQKGVKTKLINELYQPKTKVISLYYKWAIAASFILIGTLLGINYYKSYTVSTFSSAIGQTKEIKLPDGSIVELYGNSEIRLKNSDWKNNKRNLKLNGEAYFKVQKGSKFTVKSNHGSVSVLGTEFNVKTLNDYFAVACFEGKVKVENGNNTAILTRGNAFINANGIPKKETFLATTPNWKSKKYMYQETPLSVVFRDLQNVYQFKEMKFVNVDQSKIFSGKLIVGNSNKALEVICKPMNLKYDLLKSGVIISQQ